jgi:2-polyprenyl-3-methyl-5-hydroxy-6-metoxy-1,4-benzoquinol methylase
VPAVDASSSNARKHESRNPIQRALIGRFTAALCDQVARLRPRSVLEVGCGEGYMLEALVRAGCDAELTGVELSPVAVAHARARLGSRARIEHGDARELGEDGRRFDVVMMLEVLEHLEDPAAMLPVLARLCERAVVLSVPWEPWFRTLNLLRGRHLSRLGNHPEHLQRFSRAAFVELVRTRFEPIACPVVWPWTMVVARPR